MSVLMKRQSVEDDRNFFVRHLPGEDPRRKDGRVYQIQLVDRYGLATAFAYLGEGESDLEFDGVPVPKLVVRAVNRLHPGQGAFVNSSGEQIAPIDLLK